MKKTLLDTLCMIILIAGFTGCAYQFIESLPPADCESQEGGC